MASIFTKIINGEIPCHKIAEDEHYFAFLDISPQVEGHTLVIPKQEVDYIFDLEDDVLTGLMLFAKKVSKAIEATVPCERIGVGVIGLEVPHAHVHLMPVNTVGDLSFGNPIQINSDELAALAAKIRANF
ncbi:MAG: HIT family protein [Saprospiraceae bacterium]